MSVLQCHPGARFVTYTRFSDNKQQETSLEDQDYQCEAFVKRMRCEVVGRYSDSAISGEAMNTRPGLLRLLQDLNTGNFDGVIVFSLDRLSRSQSGTAWLFEQFSFNRIPLYSVHDGLVSEMHVAMRGYEGASFLRKLAADTRRGQAGAVRRGAIAGSRCYGYDVVRSTEVPTGAREINLVEAKIIVRIFMEYAAGVSPPAICKKLNQEGVPSPRGKNWRAAGLMGSTDKADGILRNELYRGWFVYGRTEARHVPGEGRTLHELRPQEDRVRIHHPALQIIADDLWEAVRERLAANARSPDQRGPNSRARRPAHLLSGRMSCGVCGNSYAVADATSCACVGAREMGVCQNVRRVVLADVETAVLSGLRDYLLRPDLIGPYIAEYRAELLRQTAAREAEAGGAAAKLADLDRRMSNLRGQAAAEDDPHSPASKALRADLNQLGHDREKLMRQTAQRPAPPALSDPEAVVGRLRSQLQTLRDQIRGGDTEAVRAREVLRSIIDRVVITPVETERQDGRGCGPVRLTLQGKMPELLALAEVQIGRVLFDGNLSISGNTHATPTFTLYLDLSDETGVPKGASADQFPLLAVLASTDVPLRARDLARLTEGTTDGEVESSSVSRIRTCLDRMKARGQVRHLRVGKEAVWVLSNSTYSDEVLAELYRTTPTPSSRKPTATPPRAQVTVVG